MPLASPRNLALSAIAGCVLLSGCAAPEPDRPTRRDILVGPAEPAYPDADRPAGGQDAVERGIPTEPPRGAAWRSPRVGPETPDRLSRRPLQASPRAMETYPFLGTRPDSR